MEAKSKEKRFNLFLALVAGGMGNVVEWYSFLVYAYLAVVISKLFFPGVVKQNAIILVFLIFAVGFLSRPIGAVILGYLGDRVGRQRTLIISQVLMAILTLAISLLPTYHQIGIYAPIFLAILRFFQGLSIAGEYTTSLCYLAEVSPKEKRGLYVSVIPASTALGILISSFVIFIFVNFLPEKDLYSWGWRACFLIGFLLSVISVWLRLLLPETASFLKIKAARASGTAKPIFSSLLNISYLKEMVFVAGLIIVYAYFYQFIYIWNPTFLISSLNFKYNVSLILNFLSMIVFTISIILGGWLSDFISRKKTITWSSLCVLLLFVPLFSFVLYSMNLLSVSIFLFSSSIFFGAFVGSASVYFSEIYPVAVRSTALSLSYNIPYSVVGGLTPAFLSEIVKEWGANYTLYVTLLVWMFGFFLSFFISDKTGKQI